ncbi:MAG: ATP-dependent Clp protease ATP-binding subunit ClpA, partial [Desulfonatronovibrio sp.]
QQLMDKKISLSISKPARSWLAQKGYDNIFGARPLSRVIQEEIKDPLAEKLLFETLDKKTTIKVELNKKKNKLQFK